MPVTSRVLGAGAFAGAGTELQFSTILNEMNNQTTQLRVLDARRGTA
jgi:hypothetical protein